MYTDQIIKFVIASSGTGDWLLRSTANGVFKVVSFNVASDISNNAFAGSETTPPAFDSTRAPFGQPGSVKFTIANTDATQSGTLAINWGQILGNGSTIWSSFREYIPPEVAYSIAATNGQGTQPQGFKQSIISANSSSHTQFEVVFENSLGIDAVWGYHEPGFTGWDQSTANGDIAFQPSIDNSSGNSSIVSPDSVYLSLLSSNDPDTGSAFNSTQKEEARIGGSYNSKSDGAFAYGLGWPYSGQVRFPLNQWATFTTRIVVGTFGTASSRITTWVAPEGKGYIQLADLFNQTLTIGTGDTPGFCELWLLPYFTARMPNAGKQVLAQSNPIPGMTIRTVGNGVLVGNANVTYNATTKMVTFAENGDTAGTARGLASWKKFVNIHSHNTAVVNLTASWTASIDANGIMNVTSVSTGTITDFIQIGGNNIPYVNGWTPAITQQLSGPPGGVGNYLLDVAPNNNINNYPIASQTFTTTTNGNADGGEYLWGKFIGIEITNFSALPNTNQINTLTIGYGRVNTQTNKAEAIMSTQPINATAYAANGVQIGPTGGYAPV